MFPHLHGLETEDKQPLKINDEKYLRNNTTADVGTVQNSSNNESIFLCLFLLICNVTYIFVFILANR